MPRQAQQFQYDVALSFAGEHRTKVERLAILLRQAGVSSFYDDWEQASLWGRDLVQHLDEVYSRKALFCVIFISAEYVAKAWTQHELKSAQARAFREQREYILPLRLDDTAVPGIRETTAFIDLRKKTVEQVADLVIRKVTAVKGGAVPAGKPAVQPAEKPKPTEAAKRKATAADISAALPIKKQFTEHDRDKFVEKAFGVIASTFKASLAGLKAKNKGVVGEFRKLTATHFTAVVYRDGRRVSECGIRIDGGGWRGRKEIAYSTQSESTNMKNDWLTIEDDGQKLFLKGTSFSSFMGGQGAKAQMTPKEAAAMFWARLVDPLQR
jgi:hypothetical protein